jgi:DNA-directed RNA polymerase specialized sigma24 family protein
MKWDDLTPSEIGPILGLSANVIRVRAHRARAKLRSLLSVSAADCQPTHADRAR